MGYYLIRSNLTTAPRRHWSIPFGCSSKALAKHYNVSVRTAQRWLKSGFIKGAFRTREGWWVPHKEFIDDRTYATSTRSFE